MRKPNLLVGAVGGLIMASLLSVVAVIAFVIRSSQSFERLGITLVSTIALYFAGGVVGGLLVGLLLPLTTWRWGAVVVGIVAALPVYLGAGLLLELGDWTTGVFLAIIVGGVVGFQAWVPEDRSQAEDG